MPKMLPKALPQILNCKTICLWISSCAVCAHKQKVLACLWRMAPSFLHFEGKKVITWQLPNPSLCTILRADINMVCWHRPFGGCGRQTPRKFRVLWNADQLFGTRLLEAVELSLWDASPAGCGVELGSVSLLRGIMGRDHKVVTPQAALSITRQSVQR